MAQKVRFTPLGTLLSLVLIVGLILLGSYLITGKSPSLDQLTGLFGKKGGTQQSSETTQADASRERTSDRAETRSETRPESRSETRSENRSETQTGTRSEASPSTAGSRTGVLEKIRSTGVVRVGMEDEAPPMDFLVDGKRDGFDVRMAEKIAMHLGAQRVEYVETYYDELPDLLRAGEIDLMMGGYVPDPGLDKIDWSEGYLDFGLCLIVRQGSAVKEPQHLSGKKVGIYTDPAAKEWVETNVSGVTIQEFDGTGWLGHLDRGEVDAVIYDYPFAVEEVKQFPRLRIVKLNLNASAYSVGVPAGNYDLLDAVNAAIRQTTASPEFETLVKRFFKSEQLQVQALPAGARTYEVKSGDTLSTIAEARLGSASAWPQLWELNKSRLANPHLIEVGFKLQLP